MITRESRQKRWLEQFRWLTNPAKIVGNRICNFLEERQQKYCRQTSSKVISFSQPVRMKPILKPSQPMCAVEESCANHCALLSTPTPADHLSSTKPCKGRAKAKGKGKFVSSNRLHQRLLRSESSVKPLKPFSSSSALSNSTS